MMLLEVFQKMTDMAKSFLHRIHSAETDLECTKTMPVESSTMDAVCDTPQFLRIQRKDHPGQAQNITIASHFDPISTPMLEEFSQTGSLSLDSNPDPSENLAGFPQSGLGGGRSNYSPFWSSADQTGSHDLVSKPSSFLYGPVAAWTVDRDEKNLSSIGISDCSCNDRTRPGQLFDGPLHADLGHGHFDHA